jgi:beta-N-acetylhexosaminidase
MLPGGTILGWSSTPARHCLVCEPSSANTHRDLTPQAYATLLAHQLPLDARLGQLLMVQFQGTMATPDVVQMISSQDVGGVILYAGNIESTEQMRVLTGQLQQMAPIPLLTSIDQEGGTVNRLLSIMGPLPAAAELATPAQAERRGQLDAQYLHDFGLNLNLAPVVDVGTANPQLWDRTFGSDPQRVATMAGAYLTGLQQTGDVAGTLKHFPGLGSTTVDPHVGLPVLSHSRATWERIDLEPYRALLANHHVGAIMVTHILVPAVDPNLPASLSPALVTGVLRHQLGFNGVVITDDLTMGALSSRWSLPEAAVLAIKAGVDVVTGAANAAMAAQIIGALKQALAQGILSEARIDEAVEHILELKLQLHLIVVPASTQRVGQSGTSL